MERWPALPHWYLVGSVFERICESPEYRVAPRSLAWGVCSAYANSLIEALATASTSVLFDALDSEALDILKVPGERLWRIVQSELADRAQAATERQRPRFERLADVYVRSARTLLSHLAQAVDRDDWVATAVRRCDQARLLGDMHTRGSVVALYSGGLPVILYKPRSFSPESLLRDVLRSVAPRAQFALPGQPEFVDCGAHGWQAYAGFESPTEPSGFYRRFGGLIAVALALQISDLHFENVKCVRGIPFILDAECSLTGVTSRMGAVQRDAICPQKFTVLSTMLTPNWTQQYAEAEPSDPSVLGSYSSYDRSFPRRVLQRSDVGDLRWTFTKSESKPRRPTLPLAPEHRGLPYSAFENDIVAGFDTAASALAGTAGGAALAGQIAEHGSIRVRLLTRSTSTYAALLESSGPIELEPMPVPSADHAAETSDVTGWIHREELRQLECGVVPTFEMSLPHGTVHSGTGALLTLPPGTLDAALDATGILEDDSLESQRAILRASLELGASSDGHKDLQHPRERRPEPPSRRSGGEACQSKAVDAFIRRTIDTLAGTRLQLRADVPRWLTSEPLSATQHRLSITGSGLYAGLAGITYALGVAGMTDATACGIYDEFAETLLADIEQVIEDRASRLAPIVSATPITGIDEGILGAVLALAASAALHGNSALVQRAAAIEPHLSALGASVVDADLLNGRVGWALAYRRLAQLTGWAGFEDNAGYWLDRAVEGWVRELTQGKARGGLAHGLSGLALVLHQHGSVDGELGGMVVDVFAAEDSVVSKELSVGRPHAMRYSSSSWCWGVTGRLEARLSAGDPQSSCDALRTRMLEAPSTEIGACHGLLGKAILQRSRNYVDRYGRADGMMTQGTVLDRLDRLGLNDGRPSPARRPGLYPGLAGVLVYLCSIRDNASFSLTELDYEPGVVA